MLSNTACGARGLPSAVTDAGPPEDHALGLELLKRLCGILKRVDFAIDPGFANAARNQLRHRLPKSMMRMLSGWAIWVMASL